MEFHPNISPIDVIKKGAFGGTYFRDIYSNVNNKWYNNSWKEFKELESIKKVSTQLNHLTILAKWLSVRL